MSKDWASMTAQLLASKSEDRAGVGLTTETDLSPLQIAALYDPNIAQAMLEDGETCDLHSACALGLCEEISQRCSPEGLEAVVDGLPPIGFALISCQLKSLQTLLDCGDDPNRYLDRIGFFFWEGEVLNQGGWRPIHLAATHGYLEQAAALCRLLVERGADLQAYCLLGEQAIHLAATYGWISVLEALLDLGADVDAQTEPCTEEIHELASPGGAIKEHGLTPLMITAREGGIEAIRLLLTRGADVLTLTSCGRNALHIAADAWWGERVDVIDALINAGIDRSMVDDYGKSPADYARARNYTSIVSRMAQ